MAARKLEVEAKRAEMTALSEKAAREKEALKKAARAQKRRAERFESAIEKCYSEMREKVTNCDVISFYCDISRVSH